MMVKSTALEVYAISLRSPRRFVMVTASTNPHTLSPLSICSRPTKGGVTEFSIGLTSHLRHD